MSNSRQVDKVVIPANIEEFICDSQVEHIWYRANHKKYTNKDNCVNDLRRFALMCFYDYVRMFKV